MKKDRFKITALVAISVAFLLLLFSFFVPRSGADTSRVAKRVEKILSSRLTQLDSYAQEALDSDPEQWVDLGKIPEDMVVYRYVGAKLQSWSGQFPVINDEIVRTQYRYRTYRRDRMPSPLADLAPYYSYKRFASGQSYLLRKADRDSVSVVVGLKLDANKSIPIDKRYAIRALQTSDGSQVSALGRPVFRIVNESLPESSALPFYLCGSAFLFLLIGLILLLLYESKLRIALGAIALTAVSVFLLNKNYPLQSGELSSISVIFALNALSFCSALYLWICRKSLWSKIKTKPWVIVCSVLDILIVVGLLLFAYIEVYKVFVYTHINLDPTKIEIVNRETLAVMFSLLMLLTAVYLFALLLQPVVSRVLHRRADMRSIGGRAGFAIAFSVFLLVVGNSLGFKREETITAAWAESLASDRDNAVESQLKRVEAQIASDEEVSHLSGSQDNSRELRKYLLDHYLYRVLSRYDVRVQIGGDSDALGLDSGVQIERNSRFLYAPLPDQRSRYVGSFQYYVHDHGISTVYVSIEPKVADNSSSISYILGLGREGNDIPSFYSYAKYKGMDRLYLNGSYVYPTKLTTQNHNYFQKMGDAHYKEGGYLHFVSRVTPDEIIVISRKAMTWDRYMLALAVFSLVFFGVESVFALRRKKPLLHQRNSIKKTITILIVVCLSLAMAVLVVFSVTFVVNRNESNARSMMSDKTNSIRTMLQRGLRSYNSSDSIVSRETLDLLRRVSDNSACDISLYGADGKILLSTSPELFERMVVGSRINENAYRRIIYHNEGYCIEREKYGTRRIYTMYAPILGADGNILTIFAAPYMERNYDFQLDTLTHTVSVVVVFLILLMVSISLVSYFVDKAVKPLSEMSRKMEAGDVDRLEYIDYDRQDEISALVESYNRMVTDLTASTKILAQAERDKAWSDMARNVAHEIKNPLTPMRLQIQRIQRLKSAGDPSWQSKFDDMSQVLLDHIEILTDTANQFSDFAKLYSEEPIEIDLDKLLQSEIGLYDNREGVTFSYLGLTGAVIHGPKPQLVRVFVNLLNNAVQACEGQEETQISVSLRNGVDPAFYEIVFEDNGPGVSEDNLPKLFTPKFTTKSSGSGLGLSISKSILERCGATLSYSRSFKLGGACFTIRYPKA